MIQYQTSTRLSYVENHYTFEDRQARLSQPSTPAHHDATLSEPHLSDEEWVNFARPHSRSPRKNLELRLEDQPTILCTKLLSNIAWVGNTSEGNK